MIPREEEPGNGQKEKTPLHSMSYDEEKKLFLEK